MNLIKKLGLLILAGIVCSCAVLSQPQAGEVFRDHSWFNNVDDCDAALRVGGRLDYRLTGFAHPHMEDGSIVPDFRISLKDALRAELIVEKMQCHSATTGLRVSVNGHAPIRLPVNPRIPAPQSDYAHHHNVIIPLELGLLETGSGNRFAFEVDTAGHWWPQNLIYGMILRIYYDPSVAGVQGRIRSPGTGDNLGRRVEIKLDLPDPSQVSSVDLIGHYLDADLEGDGRYMQWHYAWHKGLIYKHIGSLESNETGMVWDNEWLPDQEEEMQLAALVHLNNGYSYMTEAVEGLKLERPGYRVELCKPYSRPRNWYTREAEHSQRFRIAGDVSQIAEARMVFRTWSPGYFNGIYINDFLVFIKEGPTYAYFEHDIAIETHVLQPGVNILKTGKTPLYHGQMVHGAEVQWPGIMLKIKYIL